MSTKHYVNSDGVYLGGFDNGAVPPDGAIKVNKNPKHGKDVWDFANKKWTHHIPPPQPAPDFHAAIQALINGDTVAAQAAMDKKS